MMTARTTYFDEALDDDDGSSDDDYESFYEKLENCTKKKTNTFVAVTVSKTNVLPTPLTMRVIRPDSHMCECVLKRKMDESQTGCPYRRYHGPL